MTDATQPHPYARDVAGAIDGKGPEDPASLWQFHQAIDWRERDEIDVEALNAILGWLVASGRIRELPGHRYVARSKGPAAPSRRQSPPPNGRRPVPSTAIGSRAPMPSCGSSAPARGG